MRKSKAVAFWLAAFLGVLGIHRFYLGKYLTGVLWFFTSGFFAVGYILDILFIAFNLTKDADGEKLEPPGFLHDLVIKIAAVIIVGGIIMSIYSFSQMLIITPSDELFDLPGGVKL